ncbi:MULTISPECIES: ATP-binding protein [unclassified Hydrogenobaculum]|uniref:ATP-binding protein n=1 Tax=unclassified Hydrogenobaculum TaxID=2622382 RepID=UPI0001C5106A|nr:MULTISPECIES: ATP-binding protein [unclassified Hydrogenobaculum]AEF18939.1 IstB domain protein ATP-binding protein [Hydrogenobaculum sp. 3684]AEG46226.1 DNA replication protein DnaC [Hydrogenobaculum sp. SHO]AGG14871.1 DNA replication protein DnaC [Hydrogenobaculum sp. HO]AGH93167.1 DNA replication protein [Hydrogenobaculum sp. SN]
MNNVNNDLKSFENLNLNKKSVCPKCKGKGFIITEDNTVEHCDCMFSSKEPLLRAMNIPKRYWSIANNQDILNNEGVNQSYTNAYISVLDYVNKFKENSGKGLFLIGPPGVGKTYLSVFLLLYLEEKYKIKGLFYDVRTLIVDLKALIGKDRYAENMNSYDKFLTKIIKSPILVLDDLGSEVLTDYNRDLITYIISSRYNDMRPIVITTNFDLARYDINPKDVGLEDKPATKSNKKKMDMITLKLQKKPFENEQEDVRGKVFSYKDLPNALRGDLALRLGDSIASRLGEMCDFIYIFGQDRRALKGKTKKGT